MFWKIMGLVVLLTSVAQAEVYRYAGVSFNCRVYGDQRDISTEAFSLKNTYDQVYTFQVFKSQNIPPIFTAFSTEEAPENFEDHKEMLKKGGVPNKIAQVNWPVTEKKQKFQTEFTIPGLPSWPMEVLYVKNASNHRDIFSARVGVPKTLENLQSILEFLGANPPNFSEEPPVVSWNGFASPWISIALKPNAWSIGNHNLQWWWGNWNVHERSTVQIHYPPEKHNGLSYHITFECGKWQWVGL